MDLIVMPILYPGMGVRRLTRIVNFSCASCEAERRGLRMCGVGKNA
jgi:hypothetical protein